MALNYTSLGFPNLKNFGNGYEYLIIFRSPSVKSDFKKFIIFTFVDDGGNSPITLVILGVDKIPDFVKLTDSRFMIVLS
jgi:hypothetical protein